VRQHVADLPQLGIRASGNSGPARIVAGARRRRLLHDHKPRVVQMPDDMVGGDVGHQFVALVAPVPLSHLAQRAGRLNPLLAWRGLGDDRRRLAPGGRKAN
jgi:hypothetical protein